MILDILFKSAIAFFIAAGFYFVPILVLTGILGSGSLKHGGQRTVFLIISLTMMTGYIALGNGSSRYLLIPLLLVGCFAGTGLEFIANLLAKITKQKETFKSIVMAVLTFAAVVTCGWRCWSHNRTECMDIFSNLILREHTDSTVVFAVNSNTSQKLGGILNEFNDIDFYNIEQWKDAIQKFIPMQTDNTNFYFCVEMPKEYDISNFRNWFQSCYYIFPFQMICECFKGRKRFILLKFNHKTLDGKEERVFRTDVLETLPSPLVFHKWRGNISFRNLEDYLPAETFSGNKFIEVEDGTWINNHIYTRLHLQLKDDPTKIILRNDVFWPESICRRVLIEEEESAVQEKSYTLKQDEQVPVSPAQTAEPVLLELIPSSPVIVSESNPMLYFEGAIPGYYYDSDRFLINGSNELSLDASSISNSNYYVEIQDRYLKSSAKKELNIKRVSQVDNTHTPVSVLLVEDNTSSGGLNLNENLVSILPEKSEVDQVIIPVQDDWATSIRIIPSLPPKEYDTIIVNLFIDSLKRPWGLRFETDHVFDQDFSFLIDELQETYAAAKILVVLPPAPPSEPAMYTTCDSTRLAKLSHYRICSAALRWYDKHHPENVDLIPLYLYTAPKTDYTNYTSINNTTIRSGYHFTPEALKHLSTVLGWSVNGSSDNVQSLSQGE